MLDPLPIFFEEESHRYLWKPTDTWMTDSVTSVTGFDMPEKKRKAIDAYKKNWQPRGVAVHSALENFLKNTHQETDEKYSDWIDPLLDHSFFKRFKPLAVEYRICDLKNTIGGTLDALGIDEESGKTILIDLKTQSSARANTYNTDEQLGAYLSMLIEHQPKIKVDECRTIWAKPNKTVVGIVQSPDQCLSAWVDKLDLFKFRTKEAF